MSQTLLGGVRLTRFGPTSPAQLSKSGKPNKPVKAVAHHYSMSSRAPTTADVVALQTAANAYRALATHLGKMEKSLASAIATAHQGWSGAAADANHAWWKKLEQDLVNGITSLDKTAQALDDIAGKMQHAINSLNQKTAEIAAIAVAGVLLTVVTAGASDAVAGSIAVAIMADVELANAAIASALEFMIQFGARLVFNSVLNTLIAGTVNFVENGNPLKGFGTEWKGILLDSFLMTGAMSVSVAVRSEIAPIRAFGQFATQSPRLYGVASGTVLGGGMPVANCVVSGQPITSGTLKDAAFGALVDGVAGGALGKFGSSGTGPTETPQAGSQISGTVSSAFAADSQVSLAGPNWLLWGASQSTTATVAPGGVSNVSSTLPTAGSNAPLWWLSPSTASEAPIAVSRTGYFTSTGQLLWAPWETSSTVGPLSPASATRPPSMMAPAVPPAASSADSSSRAAVIAGTKADFKAALPTVPLSVSQATTQLLFDGSMPSMAQHANVAATHAAKHLQVSPLPVQHPPTTRTFVVRPGDSMWSISRRLYGDGGLWHRLWMANRAAVPNPDVVAAGTVIVVP